MKFVRTDLLDVAHEDAGPENGPPVLLLHGWPDAPVSWKAVSDQLVTAGMRTIRPYLRGFGATRFLSAQTPRVAHAVALAQDAIDLMDALGIERFAVVGHDWGARMAYTLAALFPERLSSITALSLGYQPRGHAKTPMFEQARRYWYQWFQCTEGGVERVTADPIGFAHIQWETWSPEGWFEEADFAEVATSFTNPDWVAITLNSYRSRWLEGETWDTRYDALQQKLQARETISVPTLMIQGLADTCAGPSESEGREPYFTGGYERVLLEGVGHFPHREAPDAVAAAVLRHVGVYATL